MLCNLLASIVRHIISDVLCLAHLGYRLPLVMLDTALSACLHVFESAAGDCREGFSDVFPMETLESFHEDELEAMLCGVGEKWTVEKLLESIKCDHG